MSLSRDIQNRFSGLYVPEKLIIINFLVFILNSLAVFLFKLPPDYFMRWFELPRHLPDFFGQPWSLITYSFFHGNFMHLFWNMVLLFVSGRLFLNLFPARRFITLYFLGAAFGGFIFLLSYNLFPAFLGLRTALVGASAAIMCILIFVCTYTPNQDIRLIFINIKLWHVGAFFVILDLVQIPVGNSGGHLAHLGGAFTGFFYARTLRKGTGESWLTSFMQGFGKKRSPLKTVYKNKRKNSPSPPVSNRKNEEQHKIDTILDKISKSGYESLSKAEKDFLFKAGKE